MWKKREKMLEIWLIKNLLFFGKFCVSNFTERLDWHPIKHWINFYFHAEKNFLIDVWRCAGIITQLSILKQSPITPCLFSLSVSKNEKSTYVQLWLAFGLNKWLFLFYFPFLINSSEDTKPVLILSLNCSFLISSWSHREGPRKANEKICVKDLAKDAQTSHLVCNKKIMTNLLQFTRINLLYIKPAETLRNLLHWRLIVLRIPRVF